MRHLVLCLLALSLTAGCDKPAPTAPADAPRADAPAVALVEVPKEGKEFNPPVKPEQIPAGAYYCDMGTVEYARLDKGDGKCPICGMMLKQRPGTAGASAAPPDVPKAAEGHDHH
jgi:hypothetical protein